MAHRFLHVDSRVPFGSEFTNPKQSLYPLAIYCAHIPGSLKDTCVFRIGAALTGEGTPWTALTAGVTLAGDFDFCALWSTLGFWTFAAKQA